MNAKHHRRWVGLVAAAGLAGLIVPSSAVVAQDLEVMTGGKVVKNGGNWFIPMNSSSSKVALFSEQREGFSIYNKSKAPLVIDSVALVRGKGVVPEELTLQTADLKPKPLAFKKTTIAPKKSFDFYVRLYPVQSRPLGGTVNIGYAGGKKFTFSVKGTGRDKAVFTGRFATSRHMLLGGPKTDEMVTGMVADKAGNIYFAGQVTGVNDKFAYDLFYGRIDADGSLAWAKLWAGPFRDYTRDPGQNDETGGSSNAIDIDDDGYIYLAGSVSPSKQNNNFAALILKIDPKSGETVWEKLWRPAWPSALLAKHSAEAYALNVRGGHVYVVGTTGAAVENSNALVFLLSMSAKDGAGVPAIRRSDAQEHRPGILRPGRRQGQPLRGRAGRESEPAGQVHRGEHAGPEGGLGQDRQHRLGQQHQLPGRGRRGQRVRLGGPPRGHDASELPQALSQGRAALGQDL